MFLEGQMALFGFKNIFTSNVLLTDFVGKEILVNIMQLLINVQGFEGSLASDDFLQRRPLMSEKGEGSENQNENQNENAQPDDNAQQLCQSTQTFFIAQ